MRYFAMLSLAAGCAPATLTEIKVEVADDGAITLSWTPEEALSSLSMNELDQEPFWVMTTDPSAGSLPPLTAGAPPAGGSEVFDEAELPVVQTNEDATFDQPSVLVSVTTERVGDSSAWFPWPEPGGEARIDMDGEDLDGGDVVFVP